MKVVGANTFRKLEKQTRSIRKRIIRNLVAGTMVVIFVSSITMRFGKRDTLPPVIRIATADENTSFYHKFAEQLKIRLEKEIEPSYTHWLWNRFPWLRESWKRKHYVQLVPTDGSFENRKRLLNLEPPENGKDENGYEYEVDLAIMQAGAFDMKDPDNPSNDLVAIAPLYPEVVFVIARNGRNIKSIRDLQGKNVSLGSVESGSRENARRILQHYGVDLGSLKNKDACFEELDEDETLDAAIMVTGLSNETMKELLESGEFQLIPILEAEALSNHYAFLSEFTIPQGQYGGRMPVPEKHLTTVATTALLGAKADVSKLLVTKSFNALYDYDMRLHFPTVLSSDAAREWPLIPMHPASKTYFDPYRNINLLGKFIGSLVKIRGLALTLSSGIGLYWTYKRRKRETETKEKLQAQRNRLDKFFAKARVLEEAQIGTNDGRQLKECLDEITKIKLEALKQLANQRLQGDGMFSIFLAQCACLARTIESKLVLAKAHEPGSTRKSKSP